MALRLSAVAIVCLIAVLMDAPAGVAEPGAGPRPNEALEQDIVKELNHFRSRLPGDVDSGAWTYYRPPDYDLGGSYSDQSLPELPLPSLPSFTEDARLFEAARSQADYLGASGLQSHAGAGGTTPGVRIRSFGLNSSMIAEELSFGQVTAQGVVRQLLVDAGIPGAPHRRDLLNPLFTHIGVGCAPHRSLRQVCVITLSSPPFDTPPSSVASSNDVEWPLSDLVLAGEAFRPGEFESPESDIDWATWSDFDAFTLDEVAGPCAPMAPGGSHHIRARLIGGDYGLEAGDPTNLNDGWTQGCGSYFIPGDLLPPSESGPFDRAPAPYTPREGEENDAPGPE